MTYRRSRSEIAFGDSMVARLERSIKLSTTLRLGR